MSPLTQFDRLCDATNLLDDYLAAFIPDDRPIVLLTVRQMLDELADDVAGQVLVRPIGEDGRAC